jgi:hypothetical protein
MTQNAREWPLYRGTKTLKATPMTKAEYCLLRRWDVPADEDPAERGYTVEYQDGGKPNLPDFEGYISWSPADVFEKAYQPCNNYLERMAIEHGELMDRIENLTRFVHDNNGAFVRLSSLHRDLLKAQLRAMEAYEAVLALRMTLDADAETSTFIRDKPAIGIGQPVVG